MLGHLKALFNRRRERIADEYTNMNARERHEQDMWRQRGPEGERELIVEHQAERFLDAEEGRPREE